MTEPDPTAPAQQRSASARSPLALVLVSVLAVAALVVAGAGGWLLRRSGDNTVTATSVDAGFARDMSTHHVQAITMAGYERDNTTNASLKLLAYDIETSQQFELGRMSGWLDAWGLSRQSDLPVMGWMAGHDHVEADGLMPGMATPAEMNRLQSLHGTGMDVLFLQLMLRHHQGGLPMARYAFEHASEPDVRTLARAMITVQSNEIIVMERMLRELGAAPLAAPSN